MQYKATLRKFSDSELVDALKELHEHEHKRQLRFANSGKLREFLRRSSLLRPPLDLTLAAHLAFVRRHYRLRLTDVAEAANLSVLQLRELEDRSVPPWDLSPMAVAKIAHLYQISIPAFEKLTQNAAVIYFIGTPPHDRADATQKTSDWIAKLKSAIAEIATKDGC